MSSEGNIFPSASDSNFAEVGHKNVCANVRAGQECGWGQGALWGLWGQEGAPWAVLNGMLWVRKRGKG